MNDKIKLNLIQIFAKVPAIVTSHCGQFLASVVTIYPTHPWENPRVRTSSDSFRAGRRSAGPCTCHRACAPAPAFAAFRSPWRRWYALRHRKNLHKKPQPYNQIAKLFIAAAGSALDYAPACRTARYRTTPPGLRRFCNPLKKVLRSC